MTNARTAPVELKSFVERVERLREEIKGLNSDVSDVYGEAKSRGYDVPTLKRVIKHRARDPEKAKEQDAIFETYMAALDGTENAIARAREKKSKPAPVSPPAPTPNRDGAAVPASDGTAATNSIPERASQEEGAGYDGLHSGRPGQIDPDREAGLPAPSANSSTGESGQAAALLMADPYNADVRTTIFNRT